MRRLKLFQGLAVFLIFSTVFFSFSFSPSPVFAEEPEKDSFSLAQRIYKDVTGLTPDKPCLDWLATYKTANDFKGLTAFLISVVYGKKPSEEVALTLYTAITGLTPDQQAYNWIIANKSQKQLTDFAANLIDIVFKARVQSVPPAAPKIQGEKWFYDPKDVSIPVLMYHYISPPGQGAAEYWSASYEEFEKQITWFYEQGYSTLTADELYEFINLGKIKNPRSFLPIFDDNWYASVKERVIPLMSQYGFVPTLALYTGGIYESGSNVFTWQELLSWQGAGIVDVQSHSVSHPLIPALNQLSDGSLWQELYNSRIEIENRLGKTVNGFIAPGGSYDNRVLNTAASAGYKMFFLLHENSGIKMGDNPLMIYRVNMVNTLDFQTFVKKMNRYSTSLDKIQKISAANTHLAKDKQGSILNQNQVIAYYGHPYTSLMGILGEYSLEDLAPILKAKAREYDAINGDKGVIPAFHIVFGTVQPGGLIVIIDEATLLKYIEAARENNIIVILDHQIGKGSVANAIYQMLPYLKYDNVHLAIDPEWHTAFPMEEIGGISGYDVNLAQEIIQQYMEENNISGKRILIVHQFAPLMIQNRDVVSANYSGVDLVHDMDGFGHPLTKFNHYEYNKLADNMPLKGFKLFYAGRRAWGYDNPLMTPEEVLSLDPQPVVIIYQ